MKHRYVARELYRRTCHQSTFTVNDLRDNNFNMIFDHPNQIGYFFGELAKEGLATKMGADQAKHKAAKGRWVWKWKWTRRAHAIFGDG